MHRVRPIGSTLLLVGIALITVAFGGARPLAALALLDGRTNDKAHDTGYIVGAGQCSTYT